MTTSYVSLISRSANYRVSAKTYMTSAFSRTLWSSKNRLSALSRVVQLSGLSSFHVGRVLIPVLLSLHFSDHQKPSLLWFPNVCSCFVIRLSGSDLLEKFSINQDRYASIWMSDTSSSLVFGLSISWMALTLLGLGRNPSLVNCWPWNSSDVWLNSHFFLRSVMLWTVSRSSSVSRFWLCSSQSLPPTLMSSRLFTRWFTRNYLRNFGVEEILTVLTTKCESFVSIVPPRRWKCHYLSRFFIQRKLMVPMVKIGFAENCAVLKCIDKVFGDGCLHISCSRHRLIQDL